MSGACEAAIEVLNDILCYDKIDSGTLELRKEYVNIISFISETSQIFRPTAQDKRIEFKVEIIEKWDDQHSWGENVLPISASDFIWLDLFKMRQVIRNVLSNALKFTPEGGTVTLKACFVKVSPSINMKGKMAVSGAVVPINSQDGDKLETGDSHGSRSGSFLRISVTDTGIGIDPEHQTKMFSEIFQFKPEKLQGGGGSGLGMFISHRIMKAHGGQIQMSSAGQGKGCSFDIILPFNQVSTPANNFENYSSTSSAFPEKQESSLNSTNFSISPEVNSEQESLCGIKARAILPSNIEGQFPQKSTLNFLVVDDSTVSRKMFSKLLLSIGVSCQVHEASNGRQGVDMVTLNSLDYYDVIFMDSVMPLMGGPEATEQIRALGFKGAILGVTGNAMDSEILEFKKYGVDEVLTKPVDVAALIGAIASVKSKQQANHADEDEPLAVIMKIADSLR